jgi:uncharacterized protein (UPF0276 family)
MLFPTKQKVGVGLRSAHYSYLDAHPQTNVGCFEALTEQYLDSRGRPHEMLKKLRNDYPLALHGMSLNIGSADGINRTYLSLLTRLAEQVEPFIISDHLSWTGNSHQYLHNLLPLPYTYESLDILSANIDLVQTVLRQPLALENITTYLMDEYNEMTEVEFINQLCKRTGCQLLLDLNSVYNNSINHDFDAEAYVMALDADKIAQVHLAGATETESVLIDNHGQEVSPQLWALFLKIAPRIRHLPVIIERDRNIPHFNALENEVSMAIHLMESTDETQRSTALV